MKELLLAILGVVLTATTIDPKIAAGGMNPSDYTSLAILALFLVLGLHGILNLKTMTNLKLAQSNLQEKSKELADTKSRMQAALDKNSSLEQSIGDLEQKQTESLKWQEAFKDAEAKLKTVESKLAKESHGQGKSSEIAGFLRLLQENGRFLDFTMSDISSVSNEQIGGVARIVHQGCHKVLADHFSITPIAESAEGAKISLDNDYDAKEYRLLGSVADQGPFAGTLVHKGWRTTKIQLPKAVSPSTSGQHVIAPAEVELH